MTCIKSIRGYLKLLGIAFALLAVESIVLGDHALVVKVGLNEVLHCFLEVFGFSLSDSRHTDIVVHRVVHATLLILVISRFSLVVLGS